MKITSTQQKVKSHTQKKSANFKINVPLLEKLDLLVKKYPQLNKSQLVELALLLLEKADQKNELKEVIGDYFLSTSGDK